MRRAGTVCGVGGERFTSLTPIGGPPLRQGCQGKLRAMEICGSAEEGQWEDEPVLVAPILGGGDYQSYQLLGCDSCGRVVLGETEDSDAE